MKVAAIADLFPTLDPAQGPYVILNRSHLLEWLNRLTDDNSDQVNEVWLKLAPGANHDAVARALENPPFRLDRSFDLATELKLNGNDPLIAAGGSGILFVSFVAALVLVAGAYVVSLFSALRRRRVEFAVMSALGLGRGRVFTMLAFEYGTVTLIGAVAGVWLGIGISRIMLSFLNVTATGDKVVPPFVLQTNWGIIAGALAALAAVVAVGIALAGRSYTAGAQAGVLRNTE
jgi:putative ABC transport system permease protein